MAAHPTDEEYDTKTQGGMGEEYNRLIAIQLLSKAAHANRPSFELAIEFTDGDKFDDVAFHDRQRNEWMLIQAKHSIKPTEVTWEALFPKKPSTSGDFTIYKYFKSYVSIKQRWRFAGAKLRLIVFTNRKRHESVRRKEEQVNVGMLQLSEGEHVSLDPNEEERRVIRTYFDNVNADFEKIAETIEAIFNKRGTEYAVLLKYTGFISLVLVVKDNVIKCRDDFSNNHDIYQVRKLHSALKLRLKVEDLSVLSVDVPPDFPNINSDALQRSDLLPMYIDEDTVKDFFDDFVLSSSQPNVSKLTEEVHSGWILWMKRWVRPDVLRKLTEDQLREPLNTFKKCFYEWENPCKQIDKRPFLTEASCSKCLDTIKTKLNRYVKQYGRHGYIGLDAVEKYYVNRWISFEKRQKLSGETDNPLYDYWTVYKKKLGPREKINDEAFVEWLWKDWNEQQQCIALFAEPGMGKSTLWQHLSFRTQRKHADVEVFLVYLNDFKEQLPAVAVDSGIETAVKILEAVIPEENVRALLNEQQKVMLFFDAFDELRKENQQSIINFVKVLKKHRSNVKVLVSSRERYQAELQRSLRVKIIDVVPFDEADRRDFLKLFWKVEDDAKFDTFSKELLRKFRHDAPRRDINFIGLPLTMKMLAEVFQDSYMGYMKSTITAVPKSLLSKISINIIFLYEQFTLKCISLSLHKTWKLDIHATTFYQVFEPTISAVVHKYQLFAMEQMRLDDMMNETQKDLLNKFHQSIRAGQEDSLLLETVDGSPRFAHKAYEEYFCATYLFDQLDTAGTIRGENMKRLLEQHNVVRTFFLKILDTNLNSTETDLSHEIQEKLETLQHETDMLEAWACEDNCANLITRVLNVNKLRNVTERKRTLLHIAAEANACKAMQVLLAVCANVDVEDEELHTPLFLACRENHLDMVKLLLAQGASLNHELGELWSPLRVAIVYRHMDLIEYLISDDCPGHDANKRVALYYAVYDLEIVQMLIKRGAPADYVDSNQRTALHRAAALHKVTVVKELLECGANINAQDENGNTALHLATNTPAHLASGECRLDVVQLSLEHGAVFDLVNTGTYPALHYPSFLGLLCVVEDYLKSGADINEYVNRHRDSSLPAAEVPPQTDVIRLAIESGANINLFIYRKRTATHKASVDDIADFEEALKEGADIDMNNEKSLYEAAKRSPLEVVRLLIASRADIHLANSRRETVLHYAALNGNTEVVKELLECGVNVNVLDQDGNTPQQLAANGGHGEIAELLGT